MAEPRPTPPPGVTAPPPVSEPAPAPPPAPPPRPDAGPTTGLSARNALIGLLITAILFVIAYLLLPKIGGLQDEWHHIRDGSPAWLGAAVAFEALSYVGYAWNVEALSAAAGVPLGLGRSTQITLAATAATRLLAAGGAGGIAVTSWALSRAGHGPRGAARQVSAHLVSTYGVFMAAIILGGTALAIAGEPPLISSVPAILGTVIVALFAVAIQAPDALRKRIGTKGRWRQRLLAAPQALADGTFFTLELVRRKEPGLLGTVLWWAFDIAVLWACFWAFDGHPPVPELVMAYFLGMVGNLLPLPGGVGGVEGGIVGASAAFGIDAGVALLAVLAYRAISVWLPAIPGILALATLRRAAQRAGEPDVEL